MEHLRSRKFKSLLLLLLGWSLLAALVLPSFERTRHCLAAEIFDSQAPFVPVGEKDNRCDGSTTDRCGEENEFPENFPPARLSFPAATIADRIFVPYLGSTPPEVYLERFIPPRNCS